MAHPLAPIVNTIGTLCKILSGSAPAILFRFVIDLLSSDGSVSKHAFITLTQILWSSITYSGDKICMCRHGIVTITILGLFIMIIENGN